MIGALKVNTKTKQKKNVFVIQFLGKQIEPRSESSKGPSGNRSQK